MNNPSRESGDDRWIRDLLASAGAPDPQGLDPSSPEFVASIAERPLSDVEEVAVVRILDETVAALRVQPEARGFLQAAGIGGQQAEAGRAAEIRAAVEDNARKVPLDALLQLEAHRRRSGRTGGT